MRIGEAAAASGVNAKMIRHYKSIGLLRAGRSPNAYRQYGAREVHDLRFIGRARALGYSTEEIAALLSLWREPRLPHSEIRKRAAVHLADLKQRIRAMQTIAASVRHLASSCLSGARPECPILDITDD